MIYKAMFDGEFEKENVIKLLSELDQVLLSEDYTAVDLYFSSNGGRLDLMYMLVDYLDEYGKDIKLIVNGVVASAGLFTVLMTDVDVEFTNLALGMAHLTDVGISRREMRDKQSISVAMSVDNKADAEILRVLTEAGMSKAELQLLEEGRDVAINGDKLFEMKQKLIDNRELELVDDKIKMLQSELARLKGIRKVIKGGR